MNAKFAALLFALVIFGCASALIPPEFKNNKSDEYYEKAIVSIQCSDYIGTAFFISPKTLLTAKHNKNQKPENCFIYINNSFFTNKFYVKKVIFSPNHDIIMFETAYRSDSYLELAEHWENMPPNKWQDNLLYTFPVLVVARDNFLLTWKKGESRIIFSKNQNRIGLKVFITNKKDAMVRPGFSGAPVLGHNGQLVGMVIALCKPCASRSFFREDWPGLMLMVSRRDLQHYFSKY